MDGKHSGSLILLTRHGLGTAEPERAVTHSFDDLRRPDELAPGRRANAFDAAGGCPVGEGSLGVDPIGNPAQMVALRVRAAELATV